MIWHCKCNRPFESGSNIKCRFCDATEPIPAEPLTPSETTETKPAAEAEENK